jgi:ABC-type phosphate transport system auxiliary subunit
MDENMTLLDEIDVLLAAPAEEREPYLARVEDILSVGYARALAIEAERGRLAQRMREVAAGLEGGDLQRGAVELSELTRRVAQAEGELGRLRGRLATLRAHARQIRTAA